eukprot:gene36666-867_t
MVEGNGSLVVGAVGPNVTAVTDWTETDADLQHGETYYFTVRTINCAGVTSEAASWEPGSTARDGVTVDSKVAPCARCRLGDLVPPVVGTVWDGNASNTDAATMRPWESLRAEWDGFSDDLSVLNHFDWAAGVAKHPETPTEFQSVMPWRSAGLETTASTQAGL